MSDCNLKISIHKTETVSFRGKGPVRCRNVKFEDRIVQQVSHFNFLRSDIKYNYEVSINV
jgi:hypothetical protein